VFSLSLHCVALHFIALRLEDLETAALPLTPQHTIMATKELKPLAGARKGITIPSITPNAPKIASIKYFRVKPRWLFVKITDSHGLYGWGEATLEGHTQAVEGALDEMIALLLGTEADDIEHIWQSLYRQGFYRGGPVFMSAIAGIDIALWDLKGRRLGVPIYQLLGGKVRSKVQVYAWIGGDRPSDIEAAVKARISQGLRCVKMNATEDVGWLDSPSVLDATVERLKIVKGLGLDAGLDFHGRLHRPMAKQLAMLLEPHRPLFIEEPLLSEHLEGYKQLAGQTSIPIAMGERLYSRWDVKPFLEAGVVDILQPDISHAGGISEVKKIATLAEAYDVAIAPHCPIGPIALAACMQVDLSTPNFVLQEMSLGIHYNVEAGEEDLNTYLVDQNVFDIKEGYVDALTGPGLGIEINEEAVRRISRDTKPWVTKEFHGPDGSIREW
jgi:galactonate dehydratase